MANLDTQNKRRGASGHFLFVVAPVADGTIGATDRMQITGFYGGISPGAPAEKKWVRILQADDFDAGTFLYSSDGLTVETKTAAEVLALLNAEGGFATINTAAALGTL